MITVYCTLCSTYHHHAAHEISLSQVPVRVQGIEVIRKDTTSDLVVGGIDNALHHGE